MDYEIAGLDPPPDGPAGHVEAFRHLDDREKFRTAVVWELSSRHSVGFLNSAHDASREVRSPHGDFAFGLGDHRLHRLIG